MKPSVSIIVPVYNTEEYLADCIISIVNQTFKEWELILVNDGSTDRSEEICKKFAYQDKRIRYVYQNNKGAGQARQAGVEMAVGTYIMFCDSDDVFELDFIEKIYNEIKIKKCDIYCGLSRCFNQDEQSPYRGIDEISLHDKNEMANYFFKTGWSMCGKIFLAHILKSVDFAQKMSPNEDMYNMLTIINRCKYIHVGNVGGYNIRIRKGSITRIGYFSERNLYSIIVAEKIVSDAQAFSDKVLQRSQYGLLMLIVNAINRCIDENKQFLYNDILLEKLKRYGSIIKHNPYFRKIDIISVKILYLNYNLYIVYYKFFYKPLKKLSKIISENSE